MGYSCGTSTHIWAAHRSHQRTGLCSRTPIHAGTPSQSFERAVQKAHSLSTEGIAHTPNVLLTDGAVAQYPEPSKWLPQGMSWPGILVNSRAARWYIYRYLLLFEGSIQATQQLLLKKPTEPSLEMHLYVRYPKIPAEYNGMLTDLVVRRDRCSSCSCASAHTGPMQLQRGLYHWTKSTLSHWMQQDRVLYQDQHEDSPCKHQSCDHHRNDHLDPFGKYRHGNEDKLKCTSGVQD